MIEGGLQHPMNTAASQLRSVLIELGAPPDNRRTTVDTMKKSLRVQMGAEG
jgi:hypothetical protein